MKRTMISAMLLLAGAAMAAPSIGEPVPPFELATPLASTGTLRFPSAELQGKAMVLEFWATWCGPCVAQFPHINSLVREFAGKPLVFVSVTDEAEAKVRKFLASHPLESVVGLDRDGAVARQVGSADLLPTTVLVAPDGRLAAVTTPEHLTAEVLNRLLRGEDTGLRAPVGREANSSADAALLRASIRASRDEDGSVAMRTGRMMARGAELRDLLTTVFGRASERLRMEPALEQTRYDLLIEGEGVTSEHLSRIARELIPVALKLSVQEEDVTVPVLVVSKHDGVAPRLTPAVGRGVVWGNPPGKRILKGQSVEAVAWAIQGILHRVTVDETGIAGRFDLTFHWDEEHPETLLPAIREQLGLDVREAVRPVKMLVVKRAESVTAVR